MSKKVEGCPTCETMRCCYEHCCNWDSCKCGDCVMCGGTLPVEYTKFEMDRKKAAQREKEEEIQRVKQEEERMKFVKKQREKEEKERQEKEEFDRNFKETVEKARAEQRRKEQEAQKKIDESKKQYDNMMKMIQKTQIDTKATIQKVSQTINNMDNCLEGVRQTNQKYEEFKETFGEVMRAMVDRMTATLKPPHKQMGINPGMRPELSTVEEVAELMMNKQDIVVLTGAGLSAPSGLPTFRGEGGYWTLRNKTDKVKAEDFLTYKYFKEHPEEIWNWHHYFRKKCSTHKPNQAHRALAQMQAVAKEIDLNFTLVTQNIDGYHVDAYYDAMKNNPNNYYEERKETKVMDQSKEGYGFCPEVFEIHGNIYYMRCEKGCTDKLFPSPPTDCKEDFVPTCPKCKGIARSHTLLFDQSYDEKFYRKDTVMNRCVLADCLIVIGTQLTTGLAARIVGQAIENNALIIEVNPEPVITNGNVRQLVGNSEDIIPQLFKLIQKSLMPLQQNLQKKAKQNQQQIIKKPTQETKPMQPPQSQQQQQQSTNTNITSSPKATNSPQQTMKKNGSTSKINSPSPNHKKSDSMSLSSANSNHNNNTVTSGLANSRINSSSGFHSRQGSRQSNNRNSTQNIGGKSPSKFSTKTFDDSKSTTHSNSIQMTKNNASEPLSSPIKQQFNNKNGRTIINSPNKVNKANTTTSQAFSTRNSGRAMTDLHAKKTQSFDFTGTPKDKRQIQLNIMPPPEDVNKVTLPEIKSSHTSNTQVTLQDEEVGRLSTDQLGSTSNLRRSLSPKKMLVNPSQIVNSMDFTYLNPNIQTVLAEKASDQEEEKQNNGNNNTMNSSMSRGSFMNKTFSGRSGSTSPTKIGKAALVNSSTTGVSQQNSNPRASPKKTNGTKRNSSVKKNVSPTKKPIIQKKKK